MSHTRARPAGQGRGAMGHTTGIDRHDTPRRYRPVDADAQTRAYLAMVRRAARASR